MIERLVRDLPLPDSPTIPRISFLAKVKDTSRTTGTSETSGNEISLYLNDGLLGIITDSEFSFGYNALTNELGTNYFDDITFTSAETRGWNFDENNNIPVEWQRFGLYDLPNGNGFLTISEPYSDTTLKQIDVTVNWIEKQESRSATISTLKTE